MKKQIRSAHKAKTIDLEDTPFLETNNENAIRDSQLLVQSMGYWNSKVVLQRLARQPGSTNVDIHVKTETGPLFRLAPLKFKGETSPPPELLSRIQKFEGDTATAENIRTIRARVEQHYRKRGHQFAEVKMLAEHAKGLTQLEFIIKPGPQYRIGEIEVAGAEKVKPHLVRDRFKSLQGEHYNHDDVNAEIKDLLGSGAFAGISLEEDPQDDGTIDLTLNITEAKPEGYYFYGGAGSFEGLIIGAGYFNRNLFGNLWNLTSRAEWSGLGLLGEVSVTEPRFLGYDLRLTPSAHLITRDYPGYFKTEAGLGVELEWEVKDYSLLSYFRNAAVTLSPDGLPRRELGPDGYFLHVLGFTHQYDTRDSEISPKDGFYAKLTTEFGLALGQDSASFIRGEGQVSYYKKIFDKGTVAVGGRAGVIVPNGSDNNLPVDLRYFLGGSNTVRSFPDRELGPEARNGVPRGGEAYWIGNMEYIHELTSWLNGVLFFDAGSLSRDHHELLAGDVKYALGLGLRLDLPIGPVRLEYGHALNPEGSDPSGAFHFAIGSAF